MLPYQTLPQKEDGIAIVGIGGAGANILQCFGGSSADNVRLCILSLDERLGRACGNVDFLQLGAGLNHGLGSGGDPEVGRQAARESQERLAELLSGVRLLVMVVGLGGGTGSGAAPVLAEMAREAGIFLVSVALMPFAFEGKRRRDQAEQALEEISRLSDIVYCFENDYMEELFRNRSGARAVFEEVDRLLARATASVPMLASSPGLINLGLDELATALENNDSRCIFGSGSGYGPRRAESAAQDALDSPLVSYHGAIRHARTVIVHIAGGDSMSLTEIRQAMETIREGLAQDEDINIFFGATVKPHLGDEMRVTLIASIDAEEFKASLLTPEPALLRPDEGEEREEASPLPPAASEEEEEEVVKEEEEKEEKKTENQSFDAPVASAERRYDPADMASTSPAVTKPASPASPASHASPAFPTSHASAEAETEEEPEQTEEEEAAEDLLFPQEEEVDRRPRVPMETARYTPRRQSSLPLPGVPQLHQGELMPATTEPEEEAHISRVREMFPEESNTPAPGTYSPEAARRRMGASEDDLDTPPSLRFNDLRDMFPDN